ncbi:MAG: efflux RND transporter permease subunit [Sulfurospirillaceae bacterium]|nr:efflux RND transporter permease subunit [Sulfurospirillaceae bacterium]
MIHSFIKFSVEKSVLNHIFLIFLVVLGVFSYQSIPKEIFPPSNLDAIAVTGGYEGTSPDVLDKMAVKPIEEDISNLNDIDRIESKLSNGAFGITIYLKEGSDVGESLEDIKDIVSSKKKDFPADMNEPVSKILKTSYPLVSIALASGESMEEMLHVADNLKSEISKIQNLSDIKINGDADKELVIKIDEKKLAALDISPQDAFNAISSLSTVFPIGIIKERGRHLFVSTLGGEDVLDKIQNSRLLVGDKKIFFKDIAKAEFTLSDVFEVSHFNGRPNISITINKSKEGNAIALVKEIKKVLNAYKEQYTGYDFEVYSDTSVWIRNRLNTVISNIALGLILVYLSIFLFINGRVAFIVGIGIPVSFIIGLIASELMGYSLNMLSLLGALIALGMLVDEAIVVSENIYRHIENGKDAKTAAIDGAYEMFPAVLTATATTIFAFLPMLIMSGEMGVFMRILPIIISILLVSSLFEAFFFLPLHAKDFLKTEIKRKKLHSWLEDWGRIYRKILSFLLAYKKSFMALFLIFVIFGTVMLFKRSNFQLFPDFDNTQIFITGKVNINNSVQETQEIISRVEKILLENLSKDEVSSITSTSGFMLDAKFQPHIAENNFHIFINLYEALPVNFLDKYINPYLSPEHDDENARRGRSANAILVDVKRLTQEISQSKDFEEFRALVPGAGLVKNDIEIALSSKDEQLVQESVDMLSKKLKEMNGVYNVSNDLLEGEKELKIRINAYGQSLGFSEKSVASFLRPYFFKAEAAKMYYENELIRVKTQEKMKDTFEALDSFYLFVPSQNKRVSLREIADFEVKNGYANIYKYNGKRTSTVFGSLTKSTLTSAKFLKLIEPELEKVRQKGVEVDIKGEQKENKKIQIEMAKAAVIAIFLIFLALVWMFDSIFLSLVVLSVIPLSLLGVLVGHEIMGLNLTMPGVLGIVGLCGVVVNDGIIMIKFLKDAKTIEEVLDLAMLRLRPIMLTSVTTILGLSSLIFFASGQSVILQPMAVSLGYGLVWATLLNLFYVPALYVLLRKRQLNAK